MISYIKVILSSTEIIHLMYCQVSVTYAKVILFSTRKDFRDTIIMSVTYVNLTLFSTDLSIDLISQILIKDSS